MAIADIVPGVKIKKPEGLYLLDREGFDHGHNLGTWYDYSHLHPDYHIYTADSKDNRNGKFSRSMAIDPKSNRLVGYVTATDRKFYDPSARFPTFKIGAAEVMEPHRNKKLGRRLYEALYSHLYHHGVRNIVGGDHSTMAARIHENLAADHGLEYKNRTGGELGKPYDDKFPPYEYMLKALPSNEHENQANAASHAVMEDAILEQDGTKRVEADGRGYDQLSPEERSARRDGPHRTYFTPDGTPKNFDPRTDYKGVDRDTLDYTHPEKFFAGVGWKPYNQSPVDRIFDPLNDGDNWEDSRQAEYEKWSDGIQRVAEIPQDYYRDPRPRIPEHRATASQILNSHHGSPHSIPNWSGAAVERRNNFEDEFWSAIGRQSGTDLYIDNPLLDVKKALPSSMKENKMLEEHDAVLKDKLMGEGAVVRNPHDNVDPSATKYYPGANTTGQTEMYLRDADNNSNSAYPSIPPIPLKSGTGNWYSFSNGGRRQSFKGTKGMVVHAYDRDGNTVGSAIVHEPRLLLDGTTMSTVQPLYWANANEWAQIQDHMTRSLQDKGLVERMFGQGIKLPE